MFSEIVDGVLIHHLFQILVVPNFDLLNLMRGSEAVEEVEEGNFTLDGGQVRNRAQIHNLLHVAGAEHCKAGLTASIHVLMVAEDGQGVGSQRTSGNMEHAGEQLACDLIHIGDHQQQALRSGVGSGQGASGQGAVNSASGTSLRLHLNNFNLISEDVLQALGGPLVGDFRHGGGRSDGIDCGNVGKRIGYMRGGVVTVHGFHFSCHVFSSLWIYM